MLIFLSSLLQLRLWQLSWHWGRPAVHCRQDCRNNYRLISSSRISHAGTCVKRNYCDIAMTEKDALWISFRCTRRVFCFKQCLGFCVLGLKIDSICSFAFFHFVSGRRLHLASQRVFDSGRRLHLAPLVLLRHQALGKRIQPRTCFCIFLSRSLLPCR